MFIAPPWRLTKVTFILPLILVFILAFTQLLVDPIFSSYSSSSSCLPLCSSLSSLPWPHPHPLILLRLLFLLIISIVFEHGSRKSGIVQDWALGLKLGSSQAHAVCIFEFLPWSSVPHAHFPPSFNGASLFIRPPFHTICDCWYD